MIVIFIETSVLLASSIRTGGEKDESSVKIEAKRYPSSLGLIRKAYKSSKCRVITSKTVEDEASDSLNKAIMNTIEEIGLKNDEIMDEISIIYDDCERKLNDNLKMIDRLSVDEETKQRKSEEVMEIYVSISNKYSSKVNIPKTWSLSPKYKSVAKEIRKMEEQKFKKIQKRIEEKGGIGGIVDAEIVAEAAALKEDRFSEDIFYIASLDRDIAGGHVEPWSDIRSEFENRFSIFPRFPEEILGEI